MIGILVVGHGKFSEGIIDNSKLIVGNQEKIDFASLNSGDSVDEFDEIVSEKIIKLLDKDGLIIFTDIYGATPFNSCCRVISNKDVDSNVKIISGVSVPMLITAILERGGNNLEELKKLIIESGKEGIKEVFDELGGN